MAIVLEARSADGAVTRTPIEAGRNSFRAQPGMRYRVLDDAGAKIDDAISIRRIGNDLVLSGLPEERLVEFDGFFSRCTPQNSCELMLENLGAATPAASITPASEPLAAQRDGSFLMYAGKSAEAALPVAPEAEPPGTFRTVGLVVAGLALAAAGGGGGGGGGESSAPTPVAPTLTSVKASNDATPILSGTGTPGSTVAITIVVTATGQNVSYQVPVDGNGNWTVDTGTAVPSAGAMPPGGFPNGELIVRLNAPNTGLPVVTEAMSIDTERPGPPVIGMVAGDDIVNGVEKAAGVTVNGTAEAGSTVTLTWGAATRSVVAAADGSWSVQFATGEIPPDNPTTPTTIIAVATDAAGNPSTLASHDVVVDSTSTLVIAPVATNGIVNAVERATGVTISGTTKPNATVVVTWGGTVHAAVVADGNGSWSAAFGGSSGFPIPPDSPTSLLSVRSTDVAGNVEVRTREVPIDSVAPATPTISAIAVDNTVNGSERTAGVAITGTAEAGSSVAVTWGTITHTVTAGSTGSWSTTFLTAEVPADSPSTQVQAIATDAAGNASVQALRTVIVDTVTATPTINAVAVDNAVNGSERTAGVTITGTAEAGSSVVVTWGTATHTVTANGAGSWSTTFLTAEVPADSPNTQVLAVATDAVGNPSAQASRTVVVDTVTPALPTIGVVAGDDIVNGAEKTAGVTITGTAEAGSSVAITWGTVTHTVTASGTGSWSTTFLTAEVPADGPSAQVRAIATDSAGNPSSQASRSVAISTGTVTPTISVVAADDIVNGAEKTAGVTITGTAEAGSSVAVTWGSATHTVTAGGTGSWNTTFLTAEVPADGPSRQVLAVATNAAGNVSAQASRTVAIETVAPALPTIGVVATDNIVNEAEKTAGVTITGTAEAGSSVAITWGTVTHTVTANGAGSWSTPFLTGEVPADGSSTLQAIATDAAGNVSTAGTRLVQVETVANITLSDVASDNVVSAAEAASTVAISGNADPLSNVTVVWGGVTHTATAHATTGAWTVNYLSSEVPADGVRQVSVSVTDPAGNLGSIPRDIGVDTSRFTGTGGADTYDITPLRLTNLGETISLLNGGGGTDTLSLAAQNGMTLNLRTIDDSKIVSFERVDLGTSGAASPNTLVLNISDVISLGGTLTVVGDASDTVRIGAGWTSGGSGLYTATGATLNIDTLIVVQTT